MYNSISEVIRSFMHRYAFYYHGAFVLQWFMIPRGCSNKAPRSLWVNRHYYFRQTLYIVLESPKERAVPAIKMVRATMFS